MGSDEDRLGPGNGDQAGNPGGPMASPLLVAEEPWGPHDRCLPPRPDGPPWERRLHQANRVAAVAARGRVRRRLPEVDDLLAAGWGAPPRAAAGDAGLGVLAAGLADELLRDHHLPAARVQATRGPEAEASRLESHGLGYGISRFDPRTLAALVRAGGGVALVGVEEHRRALGRWAEDLDRVVGQRCRVDLVLAGAGTGNRTTADQCGRLLAVLDGRARLDVHDEPDTTRPAHLPSSHPLEQGTAMFVPPGWSTRLVGVGGPVELARVTMPRLTAFDLAAAVGREAVHWPLLRADVPNDPTRPSPSYGGSVFDHRDGLGRALGAMADDEAPARALARHRGSTPARWGGGLGSALAAIGATASTPAAALRLPCPGGVQVGPDQDDGRVLWFAAGRKLRLDPAAALALAPLADGRPCPVAALAHPDPAALARDALSAGLAEAADTDDADDADTDTDHRGGDR